MLLERIRPHIIGLNNSSFKGLWSSWTASTLIKQTETINLVYTYNILVGCLYYGSD